MLKQVEALDCKAFCTLVDHYSKPLMGLLLRMLNKREDAEEALQNTFLKAWQYLEQCDLNRGRFFSCICGIAKNHAQDISRLKRYSVRSKTDEPDEHVIVNKNAEVKWGANTDAEMYRDKLGEKYQVELDYLYLKGYSYSVSADAMDLPLGAVNTGVRKALGTLREILKNEMVRVIFIMYWAINQLFGS